MAGVFLWLYIGEKKEHRQDNKDNNQIIRDLQEGRRVDAKESSEKIEVIASNSSQAMNRISDKVEAVQNFKGKQ